MADLIEARHKLGSGATFKFMRKKWAAGEPIFKAASLIEERASGRVDIDNAIRFVASTENEDRYGDVVRASGWDIKAYKANPIVLFAHSHVSIVGGATRVWLEDKQLMVDLVLADAGTSPLVDSVRALVHQRLLRAVSVGFMPAEAKEILKDGYFSGYEFIKQELLEISLVGVPANREALEVIRSFQVSEDDERKLLCPANRGFTAQRARVEFEKMRAGI
jgi:HK97 family phage prohead protease